MRVWILEHVYSVGTSDLVGVFSTYEKADLELDRLKKSNKVFSLTITSIELDEITDNYYK